MSVQPHTIIGKEHHGIKLAQGSTIFNLVIQRVAANPTLLEVGRFWYNTTTKKYHLVNVDAKNNLVVETLATAADLQSALNDFIASLVSQEASKGTNLIGYEGYTIGEGGAQLPAGTLKETINYLFEIASGAEGSIKDFKEFLADEIGSGLVGYKGLTVGEGENVRVILPASTVEAAISDLATKIDGLNESLKDSYVSKTELGEQIIQGSIRIKEDVIIEGNIQHLGENFISQGTTVELGDNIIRLNDGLDANDTPVANAGLEVNRGKEGILPVYLWDESLKAVTAPKVITTEVEGEPQTVVTQEKVVLSSDLAGAVSAINTSIGATKSELEGKISQLENQVGEDLQEKIGEIETKVDTLKTDLANNTDETKGSALVGHNDASSYSKYVPKVESTVQEAIKDVTKFSDDLAVELETYKADIASTDASKGASLVGTKDLGIPSSNKRQSLTVQQTFEQILKGMEFLLALQTKQSLTVVSAAKLHHTITHDFGHQDYVCQLWIKDGLVWANHSASAVVLDDNNVEITLSSEAEIKVCLISTKALDQTLALEYLFPMLAGGSGNGGTGGTGGGTGGSGGTEPKINPDDDGLIIG